MKSDTLLSKDFDSAEEHQNPLDLYQLGILEDDHLDDESRYPIVKGKALQEARQFVEWLLFSSKYHSEETLYKVIRVSSNVKD